MSDQGWQPIASAPKDGKHVLATWARTWKQNSPHIEACYYVKERPRFGYWAYAYDGDAPPKNDQPTHWMPLPAPPEVQ